MALQTEGEGSMDFGFIDANKDQYDEYYEKLLRLLRPGGIIAVDNVLWDCRVLNPSPEEESTKVSGGPIPRAQCWSALGRCFLP
jgi:caffeoyl-CoA O-methyltransferase